MSPRTDEFRRRVLAGLDAEIDTDTVVGMRGWSAVLHRPRYPRLPMSADRWHRRVYSHAARLEVTGPRGLPWPVPMEALGLPAWHPTRPGVLAGLGLVDGQLGCWIADATTTDLTVLDTPAAAPGGLFGVESPLAWTGPGTHLVIPVPEHPREQAETGASWVFEAMPGAHLRLLPGGRGDPQPWPWLRYVAVRADGTEQVPVAMRARCYDSVRTDARGRIAAYAVKTGSEGPTLAVGALDNAEEHKIDLAGAQLNGYAWTANALITVTHTAADGVRITAHAPPGIAEPTRLVHQQPGTVASPLWHDRTTGALHVLLDAQGHQTLASVVPDPGPDGRRVHFRPLVEAVPTPCRIQALSLEGDRLRLSVLTKTETSWEPLVRDLPGVGSVEGSRSRPEEAVEPPDTRVLTHLGRYRGQQRGFAPPLPVQIDDGNTQVFLYAPVDQTAPEGTLLWLQSAANQAPWPPTADPTYGRPPIWLTWAGYAVAVVHLDLAWWPGTPDAAIGDRITEQITAALEGVDRHGDSGKLAVGGFSFGATLALLAVSSLDRLTAAIACSGAYSRHLTALGFEHEHRTLWQAPQVYRDFDAIVNAPRIRRPVLLIHGRHDAHPATPVLQAQLLFQALTANGTPTRLVIMPGEGHGSATRDAITTALAEQAAWLDRWLSAPAVLGDQGSPRRNRGHGQADAVASGPHAGTGS